jgi:thioredoxin 1
MKELIHFTATWCQPCKRMAPMIDQIIADNPEIKYTKVDADTDTQRFIDEGIQSVPSFVFIIDGKETRHTGVATPEKFAELLDI